MKCITHALSLYRKYGGYISVRLSRRPDGKLNPWLIHVLWSEGLINVRHMTTDNIHRHWFKELLCLLTNRAYVEKFDDNDRWKGDINGRD